MCETWRNDFDAFEEWALVNGYNDDLLIDRIDNEKGYCPNNCRWVNRNTQNNNKRNNKTLTHDGKTATIAEWSILTKIKDAVIRTRLKRGWSVEKTLTTPTK